MGWQEDLNQQFEKADEKLSFDSWPQHYSAHLIRTNRRVAQAMVPHCLKVNAAPIGKIPSGMAFLAGVIEDLEGPALYFHVRFCIPWDHELAVTEWTDNGNGTARGTLSCIPAKDDCGNPLFESFDFAQIRESWRDLPSLL